MQVHTVLFCLQAGALVVQLTLGRKHADVAAMMFGLNIMFGVAALLTSLIRVLGA